MSTMATPGLSNAPRESLALVELRGQRSWERYLIGAMVGASAALVPMWLAGCAIIAMLATLLAIKRWAPDAVLPSARARRR